jgi:hypothetical protein
VRRTGQRTTYSDRPAHALSTARIASARSSRAGCRYAAVVAGDSCRSSICALALTQRERYEDQAQHGHRHLHDDVDGDDREYERQSTGSPRIDGLLLGPMWPARNDAVRHQSRPSRRLDPTPVCLDVAAHSVDQCHIQKAMSHRIVVVTRHHPRVAIAFDHEELSSRRIARPAACDGPLGAYPLRHVSLTDRSIENPNGRHRGVRAQLRQEKACMSPPPSDPARPGKRGTHWSTDFRA